MNIEEMNVEQLQEYRNNLKIEYYDNERRNDEIVQIVENVNNKIRELNSKNENSIIETSVEETKEEVQENNEVIPQVEVSEEKKEEAVEIPQVSDTVETTQEVQVSNEVKSEEVTPLIPAIELPQTSDNIEVAQEGTDVTPLIPTVDIPQSPVEEVKPVENAETYKKTDIGASKAIIVNSAQLSKLAASKEANKDLVFGKEEVADTTQEEMKQMMEQAQQLYAEGKTAEAEQMTAKILSKNNSEAA